jgi:hypothetical protein
MSASPPPAATPPGRKIQPPAARLSPALLARAHHGYARFLGQTSDDRAGDHLPDAGSAQASSGPSVLPTVAPR